MRELLRRTLARSLAAVDRWRCGVGFDPFRPDFEHDPYAVYAELRRQDPVHKMLRGPWLVTRYADCEAMLRDPRFSSDERHLPAFVKLQRQRVRRGVVTPEETQRTPALLRLDPPEHTRLRRLVSTAFTPRRAHLLRGWLAGLAGLLMDAAAARGEMDVIRELAQPLPVHTIGELIGVPEPDRLRLREWSDELILTLGPTTDGEKLRSITAQRELRIYLAELARERRMHPRDDLLSALLQPDDGSDGLTEDEVLETCSLLLVAGHETTTNLIGNGIAALLAHPDQLAWLRAHPDAIPAAIDELLRFDSPVQLTSRIALEDIDWAGKRIRRGEEVALILGSANRDPEVFPDPDRLDLKRQGSRRHLSFGLGPHYCLGAALARVEVEVALRAWLERTPNVALCGRPLRRPGMVLRGLATLPIRFDPTFQPQPAALAAPSNPGLGLARA